MVAASPPRPAASLSVCIITRNEKNNLPRCLASVSGVASQIVVVDSHSTDGTDLIAKAAGAEVWSQEFLGYVKQKTCAMDKATGDWVLCLDADEWLDDSLHRAIEELLNQPRPPAVDGYELNRRTFYLGGWINFSGWSPEWRLRLVRRGKAWWEGIDPHDRLTVPGARSRLRGRLCHYPYDSLAGHVRKINRYTDLLSSHRLRSGAAVSFPLLVIAPFFWFLRSYIGRAGFRDGTRGFMISVMGAFYVFLKHAKIWETIHGGTPLKTERDTGSD